MNAPLAPLDRPHLAPADLDLMFREARTHNRWLDRPVPEALLREAMALALMGPTAVNALPMRVVVVSSPEAKAKLKEAMSPGNVEKTMAAPVTAVIAYDREFYEELPRFFPHADARSWFVGNDAMIARTASQNVALQSAYLIMALRAVGLDTGPMGGFDADKLDAAFFPGGRCRTDLVVNIGYGDPAGLFPRLPRPAFDEVARFA